MKICNKCGAQLIDEAVFCTNCGVSLEDNLEETGRLLYDDNKLNTTVLDDNDEMNTSVLDEDIQIPPTNEVNPFICEEPISEPTQNAVPPQYVNPMYQDTNNIQVKTQQTNQFSQPNPYAQPVPVSQGNTYGQSWNPPQTKIEQPTLKSCYKKFWNNYANFNGRSRRSDYWYVVLANILVSVCGFIVTFLITFIPSLLFNNLAITYIGGRVFGFAIMVYGFASIIPSFALFIRRMHDLGKEWYYIFFLLIPIAGPLVMLIWLFTDSQVGANKFGENPKGIN